MSATLPCLGNVCYLTLSWHRQLPYPVFATSVPYPCPGNVSYLTLSCQPLLAYPVQATSTTLSYPGNVCYLTLSWQCQLPYPILATSATLPCPGTVRYLTLSWHRQLPYLGVQNESIYNMCHLQFTQIKNPYFEVIDSFLLYLNDNNDVELISLNAK